MCFMLLNHPPSTILAQPWTELAINTDREQTQCSNRSSDSNISTKNSYPVPNGLKSLAQGRGDSRDNPQRGWERDDDCEREGDDDKQSLTELEAKEEMEDEEEDDWLEEEVLKMNRILMFEKWQRQRTFGPPRPT